MWRKEWPKIPSTLTSLFLLHLNAGLFIAFCVAGYHTFIALLAIYEFLIAIKNKNRLPQTITGILLIVIISILLISPVLFPALESYVEKTLIENIELNSRTENENNLDDAYFGGFNWGTLWILVQKVDVYPCSHCVLVMANNDLFLLNNVWLEYLHRRFAYLSVYLLLLLNAA